MRLADLRAAVCDANRELARRRLVTYTWGNVSGIDRASGLFAIKPSGVAYEDLTPESLVLLDLDGRVVEGTLNPSSDTKTHLELYRAFPDIGGVCHTHSPYATAWAQAAEDIPCLGTTHADTFRGPVPCVRALTPAELAEDYEGNTGRVIVAAFRERALDPRHLPAALCAHHGPFTWGRDAAQSVVHAVILEEVARMALLTRQLNPAAPPAPQALQDTHFLRKHGPHATYGQR